MTTIVSQGLGLGSIYRDGPGGPPVTTIRSQGLGLGSIYRDGPRGATCDDIVVDRAHTRTIGIRIDINRFGRYVGTAGIVTHGFLADLTSGIEVDELPTMLASRSVIKGVLLCCVVM